MKAVCNSIDVATLGPALQHQLGTVAVSQDMRDFANDFVALQAARHRADYDPQAAFTHSDAIDAVDQAELALQAFGRTNGDERADILALMLAIARD